MGDMADMVNDPGGAFDPNDVYEALHRCRYCGERNLKWVQVDTKWRLSSSDSQLHVCAQYKK